ncbi:uncharacterized protein LOC119271436 [Triticum dicoccoides]|uniref:uncharacterized protein LOC119271436 n=1 Tax=Triticum dicoccoides TaxID=85692 RepID=UPI00188F37B7|nr:uncharacterized protein LOC119271436 [Triticum dicoccoides]XP_044336930.1 uncharacterized protein LOC123058189 [Triticum aestivum]
MSRAPASSLRARGPALKPPCCISGNELDAVLCVACLNPALVFSPGRTPRRTPPAPSLAPSTSRNEPGRRAQAASPFLAFTRLTGRYCHAAVLSIRAAGARRPDPLHAAVLDLLRRPLISCLCIASPPLHVVCIAGLPCFLHRAGEERTQSAPPLWTSRSPARPALTAATTCAGLLLQRLKAQPPARC